jgi:hypothetical protein
VLLSELVTNDAHEYKSDALLRQVILTFAAAGRQSTADLLVAGFGNSLTDSVAYEMAGIRRYDIYVIDKKSRISCMDKDVDTLIVDKVKVNSEGSLICKQDSQPTVTTQDSSVIASQHSEASTSALPRSIRPNSRSYATLIGSSYSGYHDPELLEDVKEKMAQVRA